MELPSNLRCPDHKSYRGKGKPRTDCADCAFIYAGAHASPAPGDEVVPARKPRVVFFDIETNNLKADFGWVLCGSWKVLGEKKVHTVALYDFPKVWKDDPTNDREVVRQLRDDLSTADVLVAHYGVRFDKRYLNTRLLKWGMSPMPPIPLVDTWRIARDNLALSSNRLKSIERFFELDQTEDGFKKTELSADAWRRAPTGHMPSMRYVVEHCEADVIQLEKVYMILRKAATNHPNMCLATRLDACPKCGIGKLVGHGVQFARTGIAQRYKCNDCGAYSQGAYQRVAEVNAR